MKKKIAIASATVLALVVSIFVAVQPALAAVGIRVTNGRLVEANGTPLVLRGVNHAHTWYKTQTSSYAAIKARGANAVRVVVSGGRWQPAETAADITNIINLCKQNRLICVLENHDTTGFGEQGGAVSLDAAVNYWISVQSALTGQENYVILNIGNEPFGNNAVTPNWTQATSSAIQRLRNAGFQHTIMVDSPNWGQDWQFQARDNAPTVLAADTSGNTIFSIHMYGVFDTAAEVNAYVDSFTSRNLALCICEFGFNHSDGDPNEDAIMAKAQTANIGMMGWSWSGNSGGVEYLDMVQNNGGTFNHNVLTSWGTRYLTGANNMSVNSREASIYSGQTQPPDTQAPSVPGTPSSGGVTSSSITINWTASTDNVGVTGYDIFRAPGTSGGTFTSVGTSTTNSFTNTGLAANQTFRYQVRARDAANNASAFSASSAAITTSGGGTGASCSATPTTQTQWSNGYVIQPVTVTNTGTTNITSWTVTFTLPAGHTIAGSWNAAFTPSGQTITARNMSYNGNLGPSQSTSFGYQGSRPSGNTAVPSGYTCTPS